MRHAELKKLMTLLLVVSVLLTIPLLATAGPKIVSRKATEPVPAEEIEEDTAIEPPLVDTPTVAKSSEARDAYWARKQDVTGFEVGFRVGSFTASDDWIDPDGNANYGGFGLNVKWRFDPNWAIDMGVDAMFRSADNGPYDESRSVTNFGALYYFGDPSWWQSFLSFGIMGSTVEVLDDRFSPGSYAYDEFGGYIGFGVDFYLDNWRINNEIRLAGMGHDNYEIPSYTESDGISEGRAAFQWFVGTSYSF